MTTVSVRAKTAADEAWVRAVLTERWGTTVVVTLGGRHDAALLDGLIAEHAGERVGLLTYRIADGECEAVTVDSFLDGHGVGTALRAAVADLARERGCRRAWLITTNDNTPAVRFYQRRGWDLVRLHHGLVDEWRRTLQPEIPERGLDGIPLAHALELERVL